MDNDSTIATRFNVSRETMDKLSAYQDLLERWQNKTNLVAPSTIKDYWNRHVADSIQCCRIKPDTKIWTDLGSGGGFPGMVIAAEMADIDGIHVSLVESNTKKCAFLRAVAREISVNVEINNMRIEDFVSNDNAPEVVTARALTNLNSLLTYCELWISGKTIGLFHKGRDYQKELEECHDKWRFDLIEHRSKIADDSVILEISNLSRRKQ